MLSHNQWNKMLWWRVTALDHFDFNRNVFIFPKFLNEGTKNGWDKMLTIRFNATILLHFKISEDSLFSLMMKPNNSLIMHNTHVVSYIYVNYTTWMQREDQNTHISCYLIRLTLTTIIPFPYSFPKQPSPSRYSINTVHPLSIIICTHWSVC